MNEIMQTLHCHKKGPHLNTIEKFHIHTESIANNQLNDDHTIFPNSIFDSLSRNNRPKPSHPDNRRIRTPNSHPQTRTHQPLHIAHTLCSLAQIDTTQER